MNCKTLFFMFTYCSFTAHGPVMGNPVKMKPAYFDPHNPDKSLAFPDFLLPHTEYPNKPKVCMYKGEEFSDGTVVATDEPCLKCKCFGGSLICYLRVCPALPDPPPPHCVLVFRKGACCSELVCEDGGVSTNHISRAEPSSVDHLLDSTISFAGGKGCIDNGTLYASGSAMSTSSLCEYCYCISGKQKCVKPKCLLPATGCQPTRSPHSCCPISYSCNKNTTTSTTTQTSFNDQAGCFQNGIFYPEGERVPIVDTPCKNCFCIRSKVKCANLSCAPALLDCTPIIEPGKCCASSYNCSKHKTNLPNNSKLSNTDKEAISNERSFPGDTLLTPSQIAEILLGSEKRSTGNGNAEKQNSDKKNSKIAVTIVTTPNDNNSSNFISSKKFTIPPSLGSSSAKAVTKFTTFNDSIAGENKVSSQKIVNREAENDKISNKTESNATIHKLETNAKNTSRFHDTTDSGVLGKQSEHIPTDEDYTPMSTVVILDTVNCTTEITSGEDFSTTERNPPESTTISMIIYNDTQERTPVLLDTIDADDLISANKNKDFIEENITESDVNVGSQFPSHSLIIPKDDDVFMVNVSTFVRTNTSVVTLKPVAAIPPEIEAILNMSMKNQKDDYYDYDYKSALPPSLPNLEIIPFLATDAVVNEKKSNQKKQFTKPEYLTNENKNYLHSRENYNSTANPHIPPTTFASFSERHSNLPSTNYKKTPVYKQHINDKFITSTYSSTFGRYDNFPFAPEKTFNVATRGPEKITSIYDSKIMNLFSPPVKTEGGFLPRDPPVESYYDTEFSSQGDDLYSVTDGSLMVTNHAKITGDNCISNGKEYKNRELITEPRSCVVCFCYYGDIHCQDPECPPIKPGCRRITEKGSTSCCGLEICNEDGFEEKKADKNKNDENSIASPVPIYQPKDINTLESTTPTREEGWIETKERVSTTVSPIESIIGTESTFVASSNFEDKVVLESTIPSTTTKSTQSYDDYIDAKKTQDEIPFIGNVDISSEKSEESTTVNSFLDDIEQDGEEPDTFTDESDDDEGFNFDSVLKYLLGDDSTTKTPPKSTTKFYESTTKPTTVTSPSTVKLISLPSVTSTTTISTTTSPTVPSTQSSTLHLSSDKSYSKIPSSLIPFKIIPPTTEPYSPSFKNFYKLPHKIGKNATTFAPAYKSSLSKFRITTKPPIAFQSTLHRFTKLKFAPTPFPFAADSTKMIAPPYYPNNDPQQAYKKKISNADTSLPFGAGLLKLAGCNIYGRMYRVGKIITELSGPCLQCMCTEVGVQCKTLFGPNCE